MSYDDEDERELSAALQELGENMQEIISLGGKHLAEEYYQHLIRDSLEQGKREHLLVLKEIAVFFR